jgi:hypothetical protein
MEQTNQTAVQTDAAVTESKATIKIEGQEFELETVLAEDDKMLKTVLQPHFSSVENANITREVKNGKLIVTIVKKAQHKGAASRQKANPV